MRGAIFKEKLCVNIYTSTYILGSKENNVRFLIRVVVNV